MECLEFRFLHIAPFRQFTEHAITVINFLLPLNLNCLCAIFLLLQNFHPHYAINFSFALPKNIRPTRQQQLYEMKLHDF